MQDTWLKTFLFSDEWQKICIKLIFLRIENWYFVIGFVIFLN
jgi:hypothetical protein